MCGVIPLSKVMNIFNSWFSSIAKIPGNRFTNYQGSLSFPKFVFFLIATSNATTSAPALSELWCHFIACSHAGTITPTDVVTLARVCIPSKVSQSVKNLRTKFVKEEIYQLRNRASRCLQKSMGWTCPTSWRGRWRSQCNCKPVSSVRWNASCRRSLPPPINFYWELWHGSAA